MNSTNEIIPTEEWRKIANFSAYEVSSLGRIRSWKALYAGKDRPKQPRVLSPGRSMSGYFIVTLSFECRRRLTGVHRLVAETFHERTDPTHSLVRHLDGNPGNNAANNLAWGTPSQNRKDQFLHGHARVGEAHPMAKLTDDQVREIFSDANSTCSSLATRFSVSPSTISSIRNRRNRRTTMGEGEKSLGAVGIGGRSIPRKIDADKAREIFISHETLRAISEKYGISENFAYQIRIGRKWRRATEGLVAPHRKRSFYGRAEFTSSPLKNLTEEQVREIFMSPLIGRQIAVKIGTTEGHVSMIRARKTCHLVTKDLVSPDRPKTLKLDADKARSIFVMHGSLKEVADQFGISFNMVSMIRRRLVWREATKDLPGNPRCSVA